MGYIIGLAIGGAIYGFGNIPKESSNAYSKQFTTKTKFCYTVSHFSYAPFFQGPCFLQECWNRTFYMIIYLLTFYLFVDIKKISESLMRNILLR